MKSLMKRSSSWPISSVDKTKITEDASQASIKKQPQSSSSFNESISRRSNFDSLCSLISEELKYLDKDPHVLQKYGEVVLNRLNEAKTDLAKLKEMICDMLREDTPEDDPRYKTLKDELQKLKIRVTKLKAKFPSKAKILNLENETKKTPDELQRDSLIISMLTEQKLNLPRFYGDSVFEQSEIFGNFYSLFNAIDDNLEKKLCLLCFSVFPNEAKIRRRVMIYWWMAEGYIEKKSDGTSFLESFCKMGFLIPIFSKPRSQFHSYKLHPMARIVLIYIAQRARLFDFNEKDGTATEKYTSSLRALLVGQGLSDVKNLAKLHMIFNLNESTLEFNPEWFPKMQNINILLLGRWQSDETHHVEIENPEFLDNLKYLQFLKFLSLQGVSRVRELPDTIGKLQNLKILDLRACHNLEVIPAGIGGLKNLTHLDMSECYLIDHMPKEIADLENLKVLLGFVVKPQRKYIITIKSSCTLKDLSRLHKLEKLGIYTSIAKFEHEDSKALQEFQSLKTLSISWGSSSKDRSPSSREKGKDKRQNKVDHEAPKTKSEVPGTKKRDKHVRLKDDAHELAKAVDQAQITPDQQAPQASKEGEHAVEASPETTQQASPRTVKDEADKSIGKSDKANTPQPSPEAIKDPEEKATDATKHETPQPNSVQASKETSNDEIDKSTANIEQASPSKTKGLADAGKENSETSQQANPRSTKDKADNSVGTTEQTNNQELKKEVDEVNGTVEQTTQPIVKDSIEKSTEATEQASTQITNEQKGHQTSKDVIETSTAILKQADRLKEKNEVADAVKPIEQEKTQTTKYLVAAEQLNSTQEGTNEQKTTLLAPLGSFKEENQVESSKVAENNSSVLEERKKTNSEIEGQAEGIVEDNKSLSAHVTPSKQEAGGEISKAVDDNTKISEESKEKMHLEDEGNVEDNLEDKKGSLAPTTTTNTEKAPKEENQGTKQGNNLPLTRTISKRPLPKARALARSETILGAFGNIFQSGDQGSGSEKSSDFTLPRTLEKLQLVCYPEIDPPTWLKPESLQSLKKLHISGGKLRHLGKIYDWNGGKPTFTEHTWNVHTLRLKYLNHMEMRWMELQHLFPKLVTLENVSCPKLTLFPCDGYGMWIDKTKTLT